MQADYHWSLDQPLRICLFPIYKTIIFFYCLHQSYSEHTTGDGSPYVCRRRKDGVVGLPSVRRTSNRFGLVTLVNVTQGLTLLPLRNGNSRCSLFSIPYKGDFLFSNLQLPTVYKNTYKDTSKDLLITQFSQN